MLNKQYYVEKAKVDRLVARKNTKADFYNGIYDRYEYPVLTREFAPVHWRYDLDEETNPYFMERLGINAVMNSGAIYLNGKYYLVVRVEGNDRKSFFAVAESDTGIDGFHFWDYPVVLPDTCAEETNVYDMRLTQHEDGWIYGVFCSESKDKNDPDLSAAVAEAGIVRTKDLKNWERLDNLKTLRSPQQRNVVLHPEFVDGKYAFYTRPMDGFIETGSGGGIGFGLCDDITHAVIDEEKIIRHGKGNGVAGAGVNLSFVTIGQHDNRRIEHRRLGTNDLDALELGAQGIDGVKQQVMRYRALGATAIDATANCRGLKRAGLNGKRTQGRRRIRLAAALAKHDKRWHGTGGHDDGLYVDANHGTPPVRSG